MKMVYWYSLQEMMRGVFYSDDLRMQILTFKYILPRQAPVHNPYFLQLNYICALSFKELNETHLHIYLYPMSLTSMIGSCRLLCYRASVEIE